ncbi:hypothetical protein RIF29_25863 [Crotalaria pallida]|uniref:Uncharacterized protein n=1 Tax=Crotalaria pallida TaxID=3830 RepID=A0AAN9EUD3_CROPI
MIIGDEVSLLEEVGLGGGRDGAVGDAQIMSYLVSGNGCELGEGDVAVVLCLEKQLIYYQLQQRYEDGKEVW